MGSFKMFYTDSLQPLNLSNIKNESPNKQKKSLNFIQFFC